MSKMENGFEYSMTYKRSFRCCVVYGCTSTTAVKNKTIGFHRFPPPSTKTKVFVWKKGFQYIYNRRDLWFEALSIGRKAQAALERLENIFVCSLHFSRQDYYYNQDLTGRRYLKELTIPRRNLPARCSSPLTTKFNIRHLSRIRYRGYFNIHNSDGRKLTAPRRFLGATTRAEENSNKLTAAEESEQLTSFNNITVSSTFSLAGTDEASYINADCYQDNNPGQDSSLTNQNAEEELQKLIDEDDFAEFDESQAAAELVDPATPEEYVFPSEVVESGNLSKAQAGSENHTGVEGEIENSGLQDESENLKVFYPESGLLEYDADLEYGGEEQPHFESGVHTIGKFDNGNAFDTICRTCGALNCPGHRRGATREHVFVCMVCSDIFSTQRRLDRHLATFHAESPATDNTRWADLTCKVCGRVLSTKSTLREHVMIHTGEKPHECQLCGQRFRHKANLVVHVNGHADLGIYKCKRCIKAFTKKSDFDAHLETHVDPESGRPLVCPICAGVFKSRRTLYNHSLLHRAKGEGAIQQRQRKENPGEPKFACDVCDRRLSTAATLREHKLIHSGERPHECPYCGRMIRHRANYTMHIQTHGQGRSYECDMCEYSFLRQADLRKHKQQTHANAKLLRCAICSQVFKSPVKFNRHMEMHESIAYMEETKELSYQPHLLEGFLETDDGVLDL